MEEGFYFNAACDNKITYSCRRFCRIKFFGKFLMFGFQISSRTGLVSIIYLKLYSVPCKLFLRSGPMVHNFHILG